jgi:hypothetical protein
VHGRSNRERVARLLATARGVSHRDRGSLANKRLNPAHSRVTALAKSSKRRATGRAGQPQR